MKAESQQTRARELALQILNKIEQHDAYSNLVLNEVLQRNQLDAREVALVTELVYGTMQRLNTIDIVLQQYVSKDLTKLQPWVRNLLRLSAYQFFFLDRIPSHAIVHEAVNIAKKNGHSGISGLVNAVLRKVAARTGFPDIPSGLSLVEQIAFRYSHPSWLIQRWMSQYGQQLTEQMATVNLLPPRISIRANRLLNTREQLLEEINASGRIATPSHLSAEGIIVGSGGNMAHSKWYINGQCTIQDESSMLVAAAMNPLPGMRVLDCCAAPGGKSTHLAEWMNDEGSIIACDIHPHKIEMMKQNATRLGIKCIETMCIDAAQLRHHFADHSFDCILLDVPCSGLGVIRRKPDLKWTKSEKEIKSLIQLQRDILSTTHALLKPGGALIYSTCTVNHEENEEQIHWFLKKHDSFRLDPPSSSAIAPHIFERCSNEAGMISILPQHFGSDGFFIARLRKTYSHG
jgi:16S rRNA (cytosine967-C5)-methyltransferase